jgi:ABC-type arginine/histidine transport system permease subunit
MIADLDLGGVILPGLLVLAMAALAATVAVIRLLARARLTRLFAYQPLVELAVFALLYGLLVQVVSSIGLFS